jgi:hypothetical protein
VGLQIHTSVRFTLFFLFINSSFITYLLVSYVMQVEVQVRLEMKVQVQVKEVVKDVEEGDLWHGSDFECDVGLVMF